MGTGVISNDRSTSRVNNFSHLHFPFNVSSLSWMTRAAASGFPEMRGFVTGLGRDLAAIKAALTYEWSNGQVEGQVNPLKTIKRQLYSRANFDLLRQRVLHAVETEAKCAGEPSEVMVE